MPFKALVLSEIIQREETERKRKEKGGEQGKRREHKRDRDQMSRGLKL